MLYQYHPSPVGDLLLLADAEGLRGIEFPNSKHARPLQPAWQRGDSPILLAARQQLDDYFSGQRQVFSLRLAPVGTAFQQQVWQALAEIPFGQTRSYAQLAARIGRPNAMRAVGAANGRNPLPIVLPCHRVIGADGSLTGFAGGLPAKITLLALEGVASVQSSINLGASPLCDSP